MVHLSEEMDDGVVVLRPDPGFDEERHEHRRKGDSEEAREEHGKGLGIGKRLEQPARLLLEGKNRKEPNGDHEERKEKRWPNFFGGIDDDVEPRALLLSLDVAVPLFELFVGVLDHDDRGVYHSTDGNSNATQAHDVRADPQVIHAKETDQNGDPQRADNDEGARQMEQKNVADQ